MAVQISVLVSIRYTGGKQTRTPSVAALRAVLALKKTTDIVSKPTLFAVCL